jgi:hypothetical protein
VRRRSPRLSNLGGYPGDLLDVELARQHGVTLVGPKPRTVFAPVPAAWVLEACAEELRTWVGFCHYNDLSSGVLNACHAWRYAEEGVLSSKAEGGQWTRSRTVAPSLIDAALATRRSEAGGAMADGDVNTFVRHALRLVEDATRPFPSD